MVEIALPTSSGSNKSKPFLATSLVNIYVEPSESTDSRTRFVLHGSPGLKEVADKTGATAKKCRGLIRTGDKLMGVFGNDVYLFDTSYNASVYSGIVGSAVCDLEVNNRGQVGIIAGNTSYLFDPSAETITNLSGGAFLQANSLTAHNGYFLYTGPGQTWFRSDLNDPTTYNALWRGTAESSPDRVRKVKSHNDIVYVFGDETTELHRNTGASDFGYQVIPGATIDVGIRAPLTAQILDGSIAFLGSDGLFYRVRGSNKTMISTNEIAESVEGMASTSDAHSYVYTQGKHKFYVTTFPSAGKTLIFDAVTGIWHERETFNKPYFRGAFYAFFNGKHIVADAFDAKLYELDADTFQDGSDQIISTFTTPVVHGGVLGLSFNRVELLMETGVGATMGQGKIPKVMLDVSDDGGKTWRTERDVPFGEIGQYYERVVFYDLGAADLGRQFRFSISDPVKRAIMAAHAEFDVRAV